MVSNMTDDSLESGAPGQCTECGAFATLEESNGTRICMDCGAVVERDDDE